MKLHDKVSFVGDDGSMRKGAPMLCGRCYEEEKLYPAKCGDKPEEKAGLPMGMYHCPDCGAMLLSGMKHPDLCERCNERKHPLLDKERIGK